MDKNETIIFGSYNKYKKGDPVIYGEAIDFKRKTIKSGIVVKRKKILRSKFLKYITDHDIHAFDFIFDQIIAWLHTTNIIVDHLVIKDRQTGLNVHCINNIRRDKKGKSNGLWYELDRRKKWKTT